LSPFTNLSGACAVSDRGPERVSTPPRVGARDICIRFLFSVAADRIVRPDEYEVSIVDIDKHYAGARIQVEATVTDTVVADLRGKRDFEVSAGLSRFGDDYREVCESVGSP
jgi:hypothetical protein